MRNENIAMRESIARNRKQYSAIRKADFAMQVRISMTNQGLKNIDVAERLGVSEANVSRLLKGTQNVSIDTMYCLADAIAQPLSIFVGPVHAQSAKFLEQETLMSCNEGGDVSPSSCVIFDLCAHIADRRQHVQYKKSRATDGFSAGDSNYIEACEA